MIPNNKDVSPLAKFDNAVKLVDATDESSFATETVELSEDEQMKVDIKNLRPAYRSLVYNLAYFVNTNDVLQNLVKMGVCIRKWDMDRSVAEEVLRLDFERHVKPILIFLHDLQLDQYEQARVIEKNPLIFKQEIINLNARINYLRSKKFQNDSIKAIMCKVPLFINMSVTDLDTKLGW